MWLLVHSAEHSRVNLEAYSYNYMTTVLRCKKYLSLLCCRVSSFLVYSDNGGRPPVTVLSSMFWLGAFKFFRILPVMNHFHALVNLSLLTVSKLNEYFDSLVLNLPIVKGIIFLVLSSLFLLDGPSFIPGLTC